MLSATIIAQAAPIGHRFQANWKKRPDGRAGLSSQDCHGWGRESPAKCAGEI